jgi:hypothetical protein
MDTYEYAESQLLEIRGRVSKMATELFNLEDDIDKWLTELARRDQAEAMQRLADDERA